MKIGLINLVVDTNYGGNLQRYALYQTLTGMGHEVEYVFTYRRPYIPSGFKKFFIYAKRIISKFIFGKSLVVFREKLIESDYDKQLPVFYGFIEQNIHTFKKKFEEYDNFQELNQANFDAFIVGSDQVWRSSPARNISHYFLDFICSNDHVRKICYAISFGTKDGGFTEKQISDCGLLFRKFDYVSYREKNGLLLERKFRWTCKHQSQVVIDPTLLLQRKDYDILIDDNRTTTFNGIFYYILDFDEKKGSLVDRVSKLLKTDSYGITTLFPNYPDDKNFVLPSVEQWVRYIRDARFVITDSFHGTMFCIIYNKPFAMILNEDRGIERYSPILEDLNLTDRIIKNYSEVDFIINNIDWDFVNLRLQSLREKSLFFLHKSLA